MPRVTLPYTEEYSSNVATWYFWKYNINRIKCDTRILCTFDAYLERESIFSHKNSERLYFKVFLTYISLDMNRMYLSFAGNSLYFRLY